MKRRPKYPLILIVISQFACTSLWFAGNGVMPELIQQFDLPETALGNLTSVVQFGFISGTLAFALFTVADRVSPSKVFLVCALLGSFFNGLTVLDSNTYSSLLFVRFLTGFCLAGIYPVGMKIAADYFDKGLGRSLGFLVGALVVGTAFPHLLRGITSSLPWKAVLLSTSLLAIAGGLIIGLFVPDGPFRKPASAFEPRALIKAFQNANFRKAAFGYFGHMWELYTFWAFVPVLLKLFSEAHESPIWGIPFLSFLIIGIGGPACFIGGILSEKLGVKRTAQIALSVSALCCLLSPIMLGTSSQVLFLGFMLVWGMTVVADSPLFSTLVAKNVDAQFKGSALTIVNSIGFAITIVSLQLMNMLSQTLTSIYIFQALAIGPVIGLLFVLRGKKNGQLNPDI